MGQFWHLRLTKVGLLMGRPVSIPVPDVGFHSKGIILETVWDYWKLPSFAHSSSLDRLGRSSTVHPPLV